MENAFVCLLVCGCFVLTKSSNHGSQLLNCTGCSPKGNGKYKCNDCIPFNLKDPNICAECSSNRPLCTTKCNNDVTQEPVTEPTSTNTCVQDHESALKGMEKQTIKDCSSGSIAGATIGGTLFGSLVTIFVFMFHYKKKQIRSPVSKALQTPAYQAEIMCVNEKSGEEDNTKGMYSEINDQKSVKVSQVAPIRRNWDAPGTNDGVYNHLNETNRVDRIEYYDHTRPGASVSTPSDGYGTVTVEYDGNNKHPKDNRSMADNEKLCESSRADEYFVLEKIQ
ncbi:uncharacterized protein LOC133187917 [Saccostrea echinata]|uniref:uncharacterized protein LOC133187917 n=1 Tax=Saccostrea echinata TaxID=191078 RepID=UPI002A839ACC|nr:uncharacterized protein LOC133187917 [Saccostrea echinata]